MRRFRTAGLVVAAACAFMTSFADGEARTLALYAVRHDGVAVLDALHGTPIRALHVEGVPNDVAVGPGGDLYVASYDRSAAHFVISRFAPNAATPFFTIVSPNYFQGSLAVSQAGEIAVSLNCPPLRNAPCGNGCKYSYPLPVLFFEPGAHEPSRKRYIWCELSKPAYGPDGDLWLVSPFAKKSYLGESYAYLGPDSAHLTQVVLQTALAPLTPYFSPPVLDGRGDLLALEPGGVVKAYGAKTGRLRFTVPIVGIVDGVSTMAVSPDAAYLFISTVHGFVCAYHYPAGGLPIAIYDTGGTGANDMGGTAIATGFL